MFGALNITATHAGQALIRLSVIAIADANATPEPGQMTNNNRQQEKPHKLREIGRRCTWPIFQQLCEYVDCFCV